MGWKQLLAIWVGLFAWGISSTVWGDAPPRPKSVVTYSADKKYKMVLKNRRDTRMMVSSKGKEYKRSGLYLNDGSNEPLWTVKWFATEVYPHPDGQHLVRMGPWASRKDYQDLAVAFYHRGKLLKQYLVNQLVDDPKSLPHTASHYFWHRGVSLDVASKTFTVTTREKKRYVFDITTGKINSQKVVDLPPTSDEKLRQKMKQANRNKSKGPGKISPMVWLIWGVVGSIVLFGAVYLMLSEKPAGKKGDDQK